ncbi:MAG TPA: acyltransferase [Terracidiphilus sp.]|nr:acyltransferase [Terracidiphilus sp.]
MQRPTWLPKYLPELDGLRGLAILAVVLYHCSPRLVGTWLHPVALWGWSGVTLFFFLSGFLITGNLLATRDRPRYFHNFHARRILRIWPVYLLLLLWVYAHAPWYVGGSVWHAVRTTPWWAYFLFLQNLLPLALPPALGPTWALAIEEQYYFLWAPAVRWLRNPALLSVPLAAAMVAAPLFRRAHFAWLTPTHSLTHLDGLALGGLLAIGLHTLRLSRRAWLTIGLVSFAAGTAAVFTLAAGTAFLDTALSFGYGGVVLALAASAGARNPLHILLRRGPLAFYGKISYGLYMIHISVFIYIGWFDLKMTPYGTAGNLAIVAFRIAASTAVAAALWYGLESRILRLKRHF